jgi:hypothetical protein
MNYLTRLLHFNRLCYRMAIVQFRMLMLMLRCGVRSLP